jgi:hypothetical protein
MNSNKCKRCGLVNFAGIQNCARCKTALIAEPSPIQSASDVAPHLSISIPHSLCVACGTIFPTKATYKGSIGTELMLLALSIVSFGAALVLGPLLALMGVLAFLGFVAYCVWRLTSKAARCPACEATQVIPTGTPFANDYLNSKIRQNN